MWHEYAKQYHLALLVVMYYTKVAKDKILPFRKSEIDSQQTFLGN